MDTESNLRFDPFPQVSFRAQAGQAYMIAVGTGFNGASPVLVKIHPGPPNDDFNQRSLLGQGRR